MKKRKHLWMNIKKKVLSRILAAGHSHVNTAAVDKDTFAGLEFIFLLAYSYT